jgi:hypothetical protein
LPPPIAWTPSLGDERRLPRGRRCSSYRLSIGPNSAKPRKRWLSHAELKVRIHSPPAGSPQTIGSAGDFTGSMQKSMAASIARMTAIYQARIWVWSVALDNCVAEISSSMPSRVGRKLISIRLAGLARDL